MPKWTPLLTGPLLLLSACTNDPAPPAADTTAPTVTLTGTPPSKPGTLALSASATDSHGVTKVEFYRGTTLISTDTTAPYTATLDLDQDDNGAVTFTVRAYDAAGNIGQATLNTAVNIHTLYEGVWGWALSDVTTGDTVEGGALFLLDELAVEERTAALGVYTNEAETQNGLALLGPVSAATALDTAFSYGLETDDLYLIASDDDGQLEQFEGQPVFFGTGVLLDRATQQPTRTVNVTLVQVSRDVPQGEAAQLSARQEAQIRATLATPYMGRSVRLGAQTSLKANLLQQGAQNILRHHLSPNR